MKRILTRIRLNLIRNCKSTCLKGAVFTVLFCLLFLSVGIKTTALNMKEKMFAHHPIYVSIHSKVNQFFGYDIQTQDYYQDVKEYYTLMKQFSDSSYISYFDFNLLALDAKGMNVAPLKLSSEEFSLAITGSFSYHDEILAKERAQCFLSEEICYYPYQKIKGVQESNFIDLRFDQITLLNDTKSRSFTSLELDQGEEVCIVPYQTLIEKVIHDEVYYESVEIGDRITISEYVKNQEGELIYVKPHEFKIIGFYDTKDGLGLDFNGNDGYKQFPIYIPLKSYESMLKDVMLQANVLRSDSTVNKPLFLTSFSIFQVKDDVGLHQFIRQFKENQNNDLELSFNTNLSSKLVSISNLVSISESFTYLSYFSLIICLIILFMVILFDVTHKRNEIGILLSLGEKKVMVVMQHVCEFMILFAVSIMLALGIFKVISIPVYNYVVSIESEKNIEENHFGQFEITSQETVDSLSNQFVIEAGSSVLFILVFESFVLMLDICSIRPKELLNEE